MLNPTFYKFWPNPKILNIFDLLTKILRLFLRPGKPKPNILTNFDLKEQKRRQKNDESQLICN